MFHIILLVSILVGQLVSISQRWDFKSTLRKILLVFKMMLDFSYVFTECPWTH